ncbi:MAG: replicative DNA helicase [Verrucomicrobiota bacterium]
MNPDLKNTRRKKLSAEPLRADRSPPHSIEAEQGTLGAIMLCPNDNMGECIEKFKSGADVFYDLRHQAIFEVLIEMYDGKQPIDLITLQQRLKDINQLEAIGGFAYLASLPDKAGTAGHLGSYAQILLEKFTLRKIIRTCSDVLGRVYEHEGEVDLLLDEVETDILRIRDSRNHESKSAKNLVDESIRTLEMLYQKQGSISGLSTGLTDLDRKTDGLHSGEFIVLAAFPSTGKTALAVNILLHNALAGIPVGMFSAEMRPVQIMTRSICSESRVNRFDIRDGHVTPMDFQRMTVVSGKISKAPIHIENASGATIGQLQAAARRMKQQHNVQLIAVDYIQLLSAKADNREGEVRKISNGLKAIAMELDVPMIALSQLNDDGKLRDSRAIGQDADSIWKLEMDGEKQPKVQPIKLNIEKCRDGETGTVNLTFLKTFTRFENAKKNP